MYKPKSDAGINTGLRVWIAFMIGFWLVGLRAELCILLGAIGGLATGWLVAYWGAEKVELKPKSESESASQTSESSPIAPLTEVFRKPAQRLKLGERLRRIGTDRKLPRLPERKPPRRL